MNVPRYRCETIPGRNQCRDVPYSVPVCNMETQYERQVYSCEKPETVTRTITKNLVLETEVDVETNGLVDEFVALMKATEVNHQYSQFSFSVTLLKEPQVYVVLKNQNFQIVSDTENEIVLRSKVQFEVLNDQLLPNVLPARVSEATAFQETKMLKILFDGNLSNLGSIQLKLTHKAFLVGTKTIADLTAEYPSEKVFISRENQKFALNISLAQDLKKSLRGQMKLTFSLDAKNNLEGRILNSVKPETSKRFEEMSVELK